MEDVAKSLHNSGVYALTQTGVRMHSPHPFILSQLTVNDSLHKVNSIPALSSSAIFVIASVQVTSVLVKELDSSMETRSVSLIDV